MTLGPASGPENPSLRYTVSHSRASRLSLTVRLPGRHFAGLYRGVVVGGYP